MNKKKENRGLKVVLALLIVVLISLVSYVGIFVREKGIMTNIIPEYLTGMSLKGGRTITLVVDTSTKDIIKDAEGKVIESATDAEIAEKGYTKESKLVNKEEDLTEANYAAVRNIIEKRLQSIPYKDYTIRQDKENGNIIISMQENSNTTLAIQSLTTIGAFSIQDNETSEVLMDNNDIKNVKVLYSNTSTGTTVYLGMQFTKEGKGKLENITNNYKKVKAEDGTETEKKIKMLVDGETLITTSFETPITNGELQLSIGSGTSSSDSLQKYMNQGRTMAILLNNGKMPLQYKADTNQLIAPEMRQDTLKTAIIIVTVIIAILFAILVIKYKVPGLLVALSHIGLVGLNLLMVRLTNVEMSIEGIAAVALVFILNYMLGILFLQRMKKEDNKKQVMKEVMTRFIYTIIPVFIIAVVFTFTGYSSIADFGMITFWGIVCIFLYNMTITRMLLLNSGKKSK